MQVYARHGDLRGSRRSVRVGLVKAGEQNDVFRAGGIQPVTGMGRGRYGDGEAAIRRAGGVDAGGGVTIRRIGDQVMVGAVQCDAPPAGRQVGAVYIISAGAAQGMALAVLGGAEIDGFLARQSQRGAQGRGGAQIGTAAGAAGVYGGLPRADLNGAADAELADGRRRGAEAERDTGDENGEGSEHGGTLGGGLAVLQVACVLDRCCV